ncbi:MAG: hypothetical protein WA871_02435 [Candidatus Acidiferrales bacterium]
MLSPADYVLWVAGVLLDAFVVVCAIRSKSFLKYLALSLYIATDGILGILRYYLLSNYGYSSQRYFYFYYYSDALLTILLFLVLMGLYAHVFAELRLGKYVRAGAMVLLAATAIVSYALVERSHDKMLTYFAVRLAQNLYFVGLILTYVLWAAIMKLHETRTRLIQFVLSLGVYFSALAATFALANLYPAITLWQYVSPVLGVCLPAAWAYTFSQVKDDDRLAVASVAAAGPLSSAMGRQ